VTVAGRAVACETIPQDHRVTIVLKQPLLLQPEEALDVEIGF
jgi:hypothetical protein